VEEALLLLLLLAAAAAAAAAAAVSSSTPHAPFSWKQLASDFTALNENCFDAALSH
jgi:hypothetical protein